MSAKRAVSFERDLKRGVWSCCRCSVNVADPAFNGRKTYTAGRFVVCPDCVREDGLRSLLMAANSGVPQPLFSRGAPVVPLTKTKRRRR